MVSLNSEIKSRLIKEGASVVGFADISALAEDVRDSMQFAISIAMALNPSIIKEVSNGPTRRYYQEYNRANEFLSHLCEHAADSLKKNGHNAVIIEPTIADLDFKTLATRLPHKTVATRAGLGWVGKSGSLITKEYGAAVRLATVLSDAEFETAEPVNTSSCGDCEECVVHCPAKAMTGEKWEAGMEREKIVDVFKCYDAIKVMVAKVEVPRPICGICTNVCPWTQKYLSRENAG